MIASSLARVSFVNFNTDLQRFRLCITFYVQCTYYIFIIACNLFVCLFTLKRQLFSRCYFSSSSSNVKRVTKVLSAHSSSVFAFFLPFLFLSFLTIIHVRAFHNDDYYSIIEIEPNNANDLS